MKTAPIFLGDWTPGEDGLLADSWRPERVSPITVLAKEFQISEDALEGVEILVAYYDYRDYSGEVFVLFRKGGVLYEVNGSHCSCYGIEGQWAPEETTEEAIRARTEGSARLVDYGYEEVHAAVLSVL